jgi:hypothetical protein
MCPDEEDAVLGAVGGRPEAVWLPGRDLVRWVGGCPDGVDKGVPVGGADATSKDLGGLGLLKVEVEWWSLKKADSAKLGFSVGGVEW